MKKIFVVAGELSGDLLGAWYLRKQYAGQQVHIQAIGGDNLQQAGAILYRRFEELNVVGIVEIVKHIPRLLKFLNELVEYIKTLGFDEVVVIDFPGFNIRLIKKLKRVCPTLKIIYFSPPQLWCWGAWRLSSLKKYCDRIVVLYPFEVAWYAQRDVHVEWMGSPVYDRMQPYFEISGHKKNVVALLPGSRTSEVKTMLPIFASVACALKKIYPDIQFIIVKAASVSNETFERYLNESGLLSLGNAINVVYDDEKSLLASCCMALSKPGTVTLELALLKIPTLIIFKVPKLTYWLARLVVKVPFMGLPNLLLHDEIYPEFIQYFTCDQLKLAACNLYQSSIRQDQVHVDMMNKFNELTDRLQSH